MNSCCNGSCSPGRCNCYAYDPNYKYSKYDLIISLIQTGLQLYDNDSIENKKHGKNCLNDAINLLKEIKLKDA